MHYTCLNQNSSELDVFPNQPRKTYFHHSLWLYSLFFFITLITTWYIRYSLLLVYCPSPLLLNVKFIRIIVRSNENTAKSQKLEKCLK